MKRESEKARRDLGTSDNRYTSNTTSSQSNIADSRAAARLQMSMRQFRSIATQHLPKGWQGNLSTAELDAVAQKLGIPVQPELPWEDAK